MKCVKRANGRYQKNLKEKFFHIKKHTNKCLTTTTTINHEVYKKVLRSKALEEENE